MDERGVDERKAMILRAIVEEYIATAQPVGSGTVAKRRELGVSSATIRNDMVSLERDGFLVQPHTSAGRIPTDRGYRHFVDHFPGPTKLDPERRQTIAGFFSNTHQLLEEMLHETSLLLSRLTDHAAVVVGPQSDGAHIRNIQLVRLQPTVAVVVTVLSNGSVEREVLSIEEHATEEDLARATAELTKLFVGSTFAELSSTDPGVAPGVDLGTDPDLMVDALVGMAHAALATGTHATVAEPVYVGGASRIAAEGDAFSEVDTVAQILEMLEHQYLIVGLVHNLLGRDVVVRIGSENERDELRECSLVIAPYGIEGQVAGTIGVLGPTRMDYPGTMAAVSAVSRRLSHYLSMGSVNS